MTQTNAKDVNAKRAATLLLVRNGEVGLEVFMMLRHKQFDFASGAFVFPGGALEPCDTVIAADEKLGAPTPGADLAARAFRVAAIRETFEESGLLLARTAEGAPIDDATLKARAARLLDGDFAETLRAEKLVLALDCLSPFAHWVTPTGMPKRFDTHFFIAAAPKGQTEKMNEAESEEAIWISPAEALRRQRAGKSTIILPTRLNLDLLGKQDTAETAIQAARARHIFTIQPELVKIDDKVKIRLPPEAGYGDQLFSP
jgi:8-oxo-dGTP pyrophosphatase MutT (NUDIX family)